jgi:hypothetical protein
VVGPSIDDVFCLYLWRSLQAPGTLYLARGIDSAQAVCAELIALGYIVRVVQTVTNVEYELRNGALIASRGLHEMRGMDAEQPVA